jgi:flagellin-like protein
MSFEKLFGDDRGVSPVIGVILMVAITVILAAVIGTFVLGLGDQISQNANAGVSVDKNANNGSAVVTLVDKGNTANVTVSGSSDATLTNVGDSAEVSYDNGRIQVIGVLPDGTETVIQTIEE